ncbi:40S ribosomal protein S10 [Halotydeus destructor]|nr:40S ribosomal protein S10 [Halotydeus destructor]
MAKKDRVAIYEYLFKEGVMVAKKDFHAPRHPALEKVPNLYVIKALQSLKSRGYVKEQFAWRHFYWYLTNEGIQYLRDYLHLPPEIVPPTLKRTTKPVGEGRARPLNDGERPPREERTGDQAYRRAQPYSGFGRGKPAGPPAAAPGQE